MDGDAMPEFKLGLAELVDGAEEAGDAAEEEPKNMKERRQRAARNALEKNA